jgi:hypothetical protein
MNKGLFAHIVATIIYSILVLFVIQGEALGLGGRLLVVTLLLFTNLIVCGISDINDWYHKNI